MKNHIHYSLYAGAIIMVILSFFSSPAVAQNEAVDELEEGNKPVRAPFESSFILENQTVVVPEKGTLEFMIQHRFGTLQNGVKDLWGLFADAGSNIRLGLNYTVFGKIGIGSFKGPLAIGIGSTRNKRIQDVNFKYGILQQTRNNRIPVSVTYFGNVSMETQQPREGLPNKNETDRYSFFHQLIISRRFNSALSVQVAPSVSHYNVIDPNMYNDHWAVALAARYKISPQSAVILDVDQPLNGLEPIFPVHRSNNPQPNFSLGFEIATSAHAFQVFVTNFSALNPQRNNVFNQNAPLKDGDKDFGDGFLIGFNITRLWNF